MLDTDLNDTWVPFSQHTKHEFMSWKLPLPHTAAATAGYLPGMATGSHTAGARQQGHDPGQGLQGDMLTES